MTETEDEFYQYLKEWLDARVSTKVSYEYLRIGRNFMDFAKGLTWSLS